MKKILFCILIFALTAFNTTITAQQKDYAGLDYLHKLQNNRTEGKTSFYKLISGTATPVSIGTPVSLWIAGIATKNNDWKKKALFALESFACSQALTFSMKAISQKPRPHEADPTLIALKNAKNSSFPSGHTSEAFATATSLTLITKKWYVGVPAYSWAYLVGHSRMYLGVHYPSDVIAGAFVGMGSSILCYQLNKWMHPGKKKLRTTQ